MPARRASPDDLPRVRRLASSLSEGRVVDVDDPEGRRWRLFLSGEQEQRVDMSVVEPYTRVISHGGTGPRTPGVHMWLEGCEELGLWLVGLGALASAEGAGSQDSWALFLVGWGRRGAAGLGWPEHSWAACPAPEGQSALLVRLEGAGSQDSWDLLWGRGRCGWAGEAPLPRFHPMLCHGRVPRGRAQRHHPLRLLLPAGQQRPPLPLRDGASVPVSAAPARARASPGVQDLDPTSHKIPAKLLCVPQGAAGAGGQQGPPFS